MYQAVKNSVKINSRSVELYIAHEHISMLTCPSIRYMYSIYDIYNQSLAYTSKQISLAVT